MRLKSIWRRDELSKIFEVKSRLKFASDEVDLTSFTFEVPPGGLGSKLSASLSSFSPGFEESDTATFEIGITKGGQTHWAKMVSDGLLYDRDDTTQFGGDATSITMISKLGERWKIAPRQSVILYDPAEVDIVTEVGSVLGDVTDEAGNAIEPIYRAVAGLDLMQLLNFVYVEKLGFSQVLTNIQNYRIRRADFSLSAPYHAVVAGQIGIFDPQYTESDNRIFIADPQGMLPAGFAPNIRDTGPGSYAQFQRTKQTAPLVNAVLVSYTNSTQLVDTTPTERVEQEIQEVGTFGDEGWQRTVINRFIKEFHDDVSNSSRITRAVVYKTETRVSARADGLVREVSIETQTDRYGYDWQLKTGYTKVLQLYVKLPNESAKIRTVQTETNQIVYVASSFDPDDLLKAWEITESNGLILVEGEEGDPDNPPLKTSLYDANRIGDISDDAEVRTGRPIRTLIERWREIGPDQIEVAYQQVNHLAGVGGVPELNRTVQHTGTVQVRIGPRSAQTRATMLIRDEVSEASAGTLPPASLDAGDLPLDVALDLARRILARHGQQPQRASITFAGLDLAIDRGSLRRVFDREGSEQLVFITGYTIEGSELGTENFSITQKAQGIVIPAPVA